MEKISDYQMLQMAYDYQYNKDDFFNAAIWLYKLMMEYPTSEYIGVAKQRIKDMGIPLESVENEISKMEAANKEMEAAKKEIEKENINQLKQGIPGKLNELINKYEGKFIKINYKEPFSFEHAYLIKISENYFSILLDNAVICHYPFNYVMAVAEGKDSEGKKFCILQIYHQIKQGTGGAVIGVGALFDLSNLFTD